MDRGAVSSIVILTAKAVRKTVSEKEDSAPSIAIKRSTKRKILEHAFENAKEDEVEVVGWLLGFSVKNTVFVCDSIPCTKYKFQSKTGAEPDPSEESKIACLYPRKLGIVGLYHSHPFRKDYREAEFRELASIDKMFHSHTDDLTLKSRSKGMKNYVSAVTDGANLACFVMRKGKIVEVPPVYTEEIDYKRYLHRFRTKFSITYEKRFELEDLNLILRAFEESLQNYVEDNLTPELLDFKKEGEMSYFVDLLGFEDAFVKKSVIKVERDGNGILAKISISLFPEVYTNWTDANDLAVAMRNEIGDDIAYLMWTPLSSSHFEEDLHLRLKKLELHLGNFKVREIEKSLPRKMYIEPGRKMLLKKI